MLQGNAAELQLIDAHQGAVAVLHPLRRRILESLRQTDSASGLSRKLGIPRQKINYHLRELEKQALVELVEEKRKGNCVERVVRATARAFIISPEALGGLAADPDQIRDRFSLSYLMALAARAIQELASLHRRAAEAGQRVATMSLQTEVRFRSAAERRAFAAELSEAVARLSAKYHDESAEGGRRFKFIVGGYPAITKDAEPGGQPSGSAAESN